MSYGPAPTHGPAQIHHVTNTVTIRANAAMNGWRLSNCTHASLHLLARLPPRWSKLSDYLIAWAQRTEWYDINMAHKRAFVPPKLFEVTVGDRGRVVFPAELRNELGIRRGDRLLLALDPNGEARIVSARRQLDRLRGMFANIAPERILSEELIRERREEARHESE